MSNMSYCRFRNTLTDLRDCEEHLDDSTEEMSDDERKARQRLIKVCERIADQYGQDEQEYQRVFSSP